MQQMIGVLQSYAFPSKRDLLFFDRLVTLERHRLFTSHDPQEPALEADFEFLCKQGLVQQVDLPYQALSAEAAREGFDAGLFDSSFQRLEAAAEYPPVWTGGREPPVDSPLPALHRRVAEEARHLRLSEITARLFALLRSSSQEIYTPILRTQDFQQPAALQTTAITLIIRHFPCPRDDVPYEDLFDFKDDSTSQQHLGGFRRWLRDQLRDENLQPERLQETLSDLLTDYQAHMQRARLRYKLDTVQILCTFPLATLENIVRLRFSRLFDPAFELRRCQLNLLDAEAKAPGRELAYITHAKARFM